MPNWGIIEVVWNDWIEEKLSKKNITKNEVDEFMKNRPHGVSDQSHGDNRHFLIGQTNQGRYLILVAVILNGNRYRIISGRNAKNNQKRLYKEKRNI